MTTSLDEEEAYSSPKRLENLLMGDDSGNSPDIHGCPRLGEAKQNGHRQRALQWCRGRHEFDEYADLDKEFLDFMKKCDEFEVEVEERIARLEKRKRDMGTRTQFEKELCIAIERYADCGQVEKIDIEKFYAIYMEMILKFD